MSCDFRKSFGIYKNDFIRFCSVEKLIASMMIFVLSMHVFVDAGLSENVKFLSDVILLLLVIAYLIKRDFQIRGVKYVICASLIWLLYLTIRTLFGYVNVLYCIFALRNWVRGIVFFLICASVSKLQSVRTGIFIIKVIYCIDFFVLLVKFIFLGTIGDDLCGVLWDNGATNVLLCVVLIVSLIELLMSKNERIFFIFVAVSSMVTAGLAELKVYFIEFWIIVLLTLLIFCIERFRKRYSFCTRQVLMIFGICVIAFGIGVLVLSKTYPESIGVLFGIGGYEKYEETSRAAYKISRAHAFREIFETYFHSSQKYNLFGLGFGTTFAVNTHLFYACHQKLYFEGGIISYLLFNSIIIGIGIKNFVVILKGKYDSIYNKISLVMAIICVILTIYDSSMYKEISYVIYFVLACGDISTKEAIETEAIEKENLNKEALEEETLNEQGTAVVSESVK